MNRLGALKVISMVSATIGLILLVFMVVVESEPGAIPLAPLALGTVGYFASRRVNGQ